MSAGACMRVNVAITLRAIKRNVSAKRERTARGRELPIFNEHANYWYLSAAMFTRIALWTLLSRVVPSRSSASETGIVGPAARAAVVNHRGSPALRFHQSCTQDVPIVRYRPETAPNGTVQNKSYISTREFYRRESSQ